MNKLIKKISHSLGCKEAERTRKSKERGKTVNAKSKASNDPYSNCRSHVFLKRHVFCIIQDMTIIVALKT